VAVVKELTVKIRNERGALADLCTKLAEKAVNIVGLMAPDQPGMAPVRVVVNRPEDAKKIFDSMGLKYTEQEVLDVRLTDKPGALGKITRKLAESGVDIRYAYATILKGAGKANIILAVSDIEAAGRLAK
jgi:hypothetical protein